MNMITSEILEKRLPEQRSKSVKTVKELFSGTYIDGIRITQGLAAGHINLEIKLANEDDPEDWTRAEMCLSKAQALELAECIRRQALGSVSDYMKLRKEQTL